MASLIYYEHYYCSRNDAKLIKLNKLMAGYGKRHGYALYHCTLEAMLELDGYCIDDIETVAMMIFEPLSVYTEFIAHCLDLGLFVEEGGKISSPRFSEWANRKAEIRCKNSENGKLGGRPKKDEPISEPNEPVKPKETKPRIDKSTDQQTVFDHWNAKGIVKHANITKDLKTAIDKAVSAHGLDNVLLAIDAYDDFRQKTDWYNHKWTLLEFLKRKNGLTQYVEKAVNVITETARQATQATKNAADRDEARKERDRLVSELNASNWAGFDSLRDLLSHIWKFPDKESKFQYIETMPERMQKIVTAPASGMVHVLKEGINQNLEQEYQELKERQ